MFTKLKKKVKQAEESFATAVQNLSDALDTDDKDLIKKCQKVKRTAETKMINARVALMESKNPVPNFMTKAINKVPFKKAVIWSSITAGTTAAVLAGVLYYDRLLGNGDDDTSDQV